jgi:hypothetical protein
MSPHPSEHERRTMALEAWADTIIPGEKRSPQDRAIAGVCAGGGAVTSGALEVLRSEEGGMGPLLDDLADALDAHARAYCEQQGLDADPGSPFVGLSYEHRAALVTALMAPGHPENMMWRGITMFSFMAWDTGAHMSTAQALASGHPGLTTMGFAGPDADGLWRFPDFSYRRALSEPHPDTTPTGSPR